MFPFLVGLTVIGAVHALSAEAGVTARSETLNWTECNIPFAENSITPPPHPSECASLAVPWDYTDEEFSETLELDLVRVKSTPWREPRQHPLQSWRPWRFWYRVPCLLI